MVATGLAAVHTFPNSEALARSRILVQFIIVTGFAHYYVWAHYFV